MEDLSPLQAFRRICNLRMLAGVYYFCLLHATSRSLSWFGESEQNFASALFDLIRFSRQSLLTGLSVMLMVALAEALLAGRRWKLPAALTVQTLAVGAGAALGTWLRYQAAAMEDPNMRVKPGWVASPIAIWTLPSLVLPSASLMSTLVWQAASASRGIEQRIRLLRIGKLLPISTIDPLYCASNTV